MALLNSLLSHSLHTTQTTTLNHLKTMELNEVKRLDSRPQLFSKKILKVQIERFDVFSRQNCASKLSIDQLFSFSSNLFLKFKKKWNQIFQLLFLSPQISKAKKHSSLLSKFIILEINELYIFSLFFKAIFVFVNILSLPSFFLKKKFH